MASNLIRPQLVAVPGVAIPAPYGGTSPTSRWISTSRSCWRTVCRRRTSRTRSAQQNIVLPAGDQKIGGARFPGRDQRVSPVERGDVQRPADQAGGRHRGDGGRRRLCVSAAGRRRPTPCWFTGSRRCCSRSSRAGDASTLAVVAGVKAKIPQIMRTLPPGVKITTAERCLDLRARLGGGRRAGNGDGGGADRPCRAAVLGLRRSTLIVATSIPLVDSVLDPGAVLARTDHQRHDARRPGARGGYPGGRRHGDDREHRCAPGERAWSSSRRSSKRRTRSWFRPSSRRCASASSGCRCSSYAASPGYLFLPLAEAIIFAMIASFILSRTLVPTMAAYLLRGAGGGAQGRRRAERPLRPRFKRLRAALRPVSRRLPELLTKRGGAARPLHRGLPAARVRFDRPARALARARFLPGYQVRRDRHAFPCADRACASKRRARSRRWWTPPSARSLPGQVTNVIDNCGLPTSGINEAYSSSGTIGPQDCDVTISLERPGLAGRRVSRESARQAADAFPGHGLHLPARRYHREDPELRPAGADRRADRRPRT